MTPNLSDGCHQRRYILFNWRAKTSSRSGVKLLFKLLLNIGSNLDDSLMRIVSVFKLSPSHQQLRHIVQILSFCCSSCSICSVFLWINKFLIWVFFYPKIWHHLMFWLMVTSLREPPACVTEWGGTVDTFNDLLCRASASKVPHQSASGGIYWFCQWREHGTIKLCENVRNSNLKRHQETRCSTHRKW